MVDQDEQGNVLVAFALLLSLPVLLFLWVELLFVDPWTLLLPGGLIAFFTLRWLARRSDRRAARERMAIAHLRRAEEGERLRRISAGADEKVQRACTDLAQARERVRLARAVLEEAQLRVRRVCGAPVDH